MQTTRAQRRQLAIENAAWPVELAQVPRDNWPAMSLIPPERQPIEVWRSRGYLVQIYAEQNGIERLSILRTVYNRDGALDGIPWEVLQRLKSECGRGALDAMEIYPADGDVVNVANMRHLWVLPVPIPFAWRKRQ
jgi:hypothetical protein